MRNVNHKVLANALQLFQLQMFPLQLFKNLLQLLARVVQFAAQYSQFIAPRSLQTGVKVAVGQLSGKINDDAEFSRGIAGEKSGQNERWEKREGHGGGHLTWDIIYPPLHL